MHRLASQPPKVRHSILRRMRAQHQTQMTLSLRPEIEPWHEQQSTINQQAKQQKPVPGAEFQKEFKKFKFKFKFKFKLN